MPGELPALALLFVLIFALNLIPAFAPPTEDGRVEVRAVTGAEHGRI